jgi:hypothetical protein
MADNNIRTVINAISEDSRLITLVPVVDGLAPPNPPTKAYIDSCLINGQYAILETEVFTLLMNLGVSPNWYLHSQDRKPLCWNAAGKNMYVARLVADCRYDEQVSCIDKNNLNLRYSNLDKKRKSYNPERRDREDIAKSEYITPFKSISSYQQYGQPEFKYLD